MNLLVKQPARSMEMSMPQFCNPNTEIRNPFTAGSDTFSTQAFGLFYSIQILAKVQPHGARCLHVRLGNVTQRRRQWLTVEEENWKSLRRVISCRYPLRKLLARLEYCQGRAMSVKYADLNNS